MHAAATPKPTVVRPASARPQSAAAPRPAAVRTTRPAAQLLVAYRNLLLP